MGLLDRFPPLDDKTFDGIVQEARSLIPRYCKEWTDHNVHDPGITFIELFAWLTEMQIYQLNRVTDRNYQKFLKLIGFYPFTVQPARVDITFRNISDEKSIEAGTEIITEINGERIVFETEEDFNFIPMSLKSVITTYDSKTIDNTQANETDNIYFSAFGENAPKRATLELGFYGPLPEKNPEKETEIQINIILFEKDLPPLGSHGDEILQVSPSAKVVWEYWSSGKWNTLTVKKDTTLALTRSGKIVFIWPLSMDSSKDKKVSPFAEITDNGLYWIRCHLEDGQYEITPRINRILLNTISAIQIETIKDKDLATSSGFPEQKVFLNKTPVIKKEAFDFSVENVLDWSDLLQTLKNQAKSDGPSSGKRLLGMFDENTRNLISKWDEQQKPNPELKYTVVAALNKVLESRELYEVESFKGLKLPAEPKKLIERLDIISDAEVKILNLFLIEAALPDKITKSCMVIQVQGKNYEWETWVEVDDFESSGPDDFHYTFDPEKGEITFGNGLNGRIPPENHKIKALLYKTTQGLKGNIPKGQKFFINKDGFGRIFGENLKEAIGGKSAESLEEAKGRAKKDCKTSYRAITSYDYEQLALSTPGLRVRRAKAIPNYDPHYPCIEMPGAVTVVVVPYSRERTVTPIPGDSFCQTILQHLNKHRLITTNVYVISPKYVRVSVNCNIYLKKGSSQTEVKKCVQIQLENFLDALKGGPDKKGWPFGRSVYASEIYQIIDEVEGVDYATNVVLLKDEKVQDQKDIIKISPVSLVYSGDHQLTMIEAKI